MDFGLDGKVAIVTGGTRGLGRDVAEALAGQGCKVMVCGRNQPETLAENIAFRIADIRKADAAEQLVADTVSEFGRLDILVNNAGGSPAADAATASPRFADSIMQLNLMAPYYMARASHPHLVKSDNGSIINIGSVAGIRPAPGTAIYGAAKAGLLNLTQSLAQEWGKDKIRVNAIIVGLAETENAEATYGDANAQATVAASLPLGRMCKGEDVANAVCYLASPAAEYISGARLNVDGGGERPYFLDLVKGG
ncbi:SDR family oxidoreductase [Parasphingorhabdus halotolerans]|uniref:SDR family oxidoreductase n=1 Tax=Parasphingorhabdus halotolerans TaxID=2725558 RepID=UPI001FE563E1|nr:SDR family oxidoreductase [Parasphingorhabdus halotolerans]